MPSGVTFSQPSSNVTPGGGHAAHAGIKPGLRTDIPKGYVVFAPFHADARYSRIKLDTISDYFYVFSKYAEIAEMHSLLVAAANRALRSWIQPTP